MTGRPMAEEEVLKKLDIPDFRHLSKDKIMQFASMVPNMEPDVAKKALEQFPEFARVSLKALEDHREVVQKALDEGRKGSERVFAMYGAVMDALRSSLEEDDLSFEEKMALIDRMTEIADCVAREERSHRDFILKNVAMFGTAVAGIAVTAVTLLGGKVDIAELPGRILKK